MPIYIKEIYTRDKCRIQNKHSLEISTICSFLNLYNAY